MVGKRKHRKKNYKSRRRRLVIFAALSLFFLLGISALALTLYTPTSTIQPASASVNIVASPSDSVIKLENLLLATGSLSANDVEPGIYQLEISRQGFKKYTESIELIRGEIFEQRFELEPLSWVLNLETKPEGASCFLKFNNGSVQEGETPFQESLLAGHLKIKLTLDGYNPFEKDFLFDQDTTLSIWMDPEGQLLHCLDVFKCGPAPKGVAFTPDGKEIWVTLLGGPPAVEVYSSSTREKLAEIDLGEHGSVEIIFSSNGTKAYISQMETAQVYEIDTSARRVLRIFDTKSSWSKVMELSSDEKTLFVANWSGNDVSEIDLESGKLRRRLPTVKTPRGLHTTPDGKYLYVAGFDRGEIDKISLIDGSRRTIFSGGRSIRHLTVDKERGLLYASDLSKDCIWVVDLKTDNVRKLAETDCKPNTIDLSPDGKVLYVSCRGANNPKSYCIPGPEWGSVVVIDTSTGKILDAIVGGNQCTALDVSADGGLLIFSDFLDNRLRVYTIPLYEVLINGNGGRAVSHLKDLCK